jgi:hypothetical protein
LTHVVQQGATAKNNQDRNTAIQRKAVAPPHKLVPANSDTSKKVNEEIVTNLEAARQKVKELTGQDIGVNFGSTTRGMSYSTDKVGADNISWHKTGRAIDISQELKWVIAKDKEGRSMFFRLYLRKTKDEASPYDKIFTKEEEKKLHSGHTGGKIYIDVTKILEENGFTRIKAHKGWEKSWNKREWWHYEKRDGLTMYEALRQIYSEKQIINGYKKFANKKGIRRMFREGFPIAVLEQMTTENVKKILKVVIIKDWTSGMYVFHPNTLVQIIKPATSEKDGTVKALDGIFKGIEMNVRAENMKVLQKQIK